MQPSQLQRSPNFEATLGEFPQEREYDSTELTELDEALVETIRKAEAADKEYLATLLKYELGSLYHSSR